MIEPLFDPYDETTWTKEIDTVNGRFFEAYKKKYVRKSDNSVSLKYFGLVGVRVPNTIADCLICIHLYSESEKIPYWKERIKYYAQTMASIRIRRCDHKTRVKKTRIMFDGAKDNLLGSMNFVVHIVNNFSKIGEMTPEKQVMSCEECVERYGEKICKALDAIKKCIREQDVDGIEKIVNEY